jgi:transcriptional regulator with XRE-family HTH domain
MYNDSTTSEIVRHAETARIRLGISQQRFAALLGITQGHYSKVKSGRVPAGPNALAALSGWLDTQDRAAEGPDTRRAEMMRLAEEITMQCIRLTDLAAQSWAPLPPPPAQS